MKTKRLCFLTALLGWGILTHAQSVTSVISQSPRSDSKWVTKQWVLKSGLTSRTEGKDDGFASGVLFESKLSYQFVSWMQLDLSPYASFFSSRVQERFDDDTYDSRFGLSYGHLAIKPLEQLKIRLGAIDQNELDNSQMVSSFRSFPGGALGFSQDVGGGFSVGLDVRYLIPTSSSLNTERQDREEMPTFQTQSATVKFANELLEAKVQGGAFSWSDLPTKVAINSTRAGNIPANQDLDAESRFRYGFSGWFANAQGEVKVLEDSKVSLKFKRFQNTDAPSNFADSQRIVVGGETRIRRLGLSLDLGTFFSEAHATPASYASSSLGNTNRRGEYVEGGVDFKDYKFHLKTKYVKADPINRNVYQDPMSNLEIWVETYEFQF